MTWRPPLAVAALLLSSCGEPPMPTISEEQAASADYWFSRVAENAGRPLHGRFEIHIDERAAILGEAWIQDPRHCVLYWERLEREVFEGLGQSILSTTVVHGDGGEWSLSGGTSMLGAQFVDISMLGILQRYRADPVEALAPPILAIREGGSIDYCREVAALGASAEYEVVSFDGRRAILERPLSPVESDGTADIQVLRIGVDARSGFPVLIERSYGREPSGRLRLEWTRHRFAREFPQTWFDAPEGVEGAFEYENLRAVTRREWYAKSEADSEEQASD